MKIGIFTDTYIPDINGVVTSVVTLQKSLEDLGHEVYIVTNRKGFLKAEREGNVFRMPGVELKWLYGYILSTPYHHQVKSELEKIGLDVIHVQQEFSVGAFGRFMAKDLGIPVVYTYHTLYEDYTHYINVLGVDSMESASKKVFEKFTRLLCESVQCIIAPSLKTKEKLYEYRIKRPIFVIPTGVDLDKFKKENIDLNAVEELRNKWNLTNHKVIAYVGRIATEKSMDIIIDGFKYVKDDNARLLIVGGGPSLIDLKKQAQKLGISDKVIFTDKVSSEEVPMYYALADAFVSASKSETQGLTFIEALAAGLSIFARPDEVLDELVYENKTGFYFNSPEEFGEKVDEFLKFDDKKIEELRKNCQDIVKKYDVKTFGKNVEQVYQKAIDDYEECFNITSIKTSDDCMRLYLENKKSHIEEELLVSLDDYMLFSLKKGGTLEFVTFESLKEKEKVILMYRKCLRKLRVKDRTRKEMYDYMINQEEVLDIKFINDIIDDLEERGYVNDDTYTIMAIEKMDGSLMGKKKIYNKLIQKGITREMIESHLSDNDNNHEYEKAMKKAVKYNDIIKNKSVKEKKNSIRTKMYNDGFDTNIINAAINELNFEDDIMKEAVILESVIDKAYKNYSKKYEGRELNKRIMQYATRKGFMYDDIMHAIEMRGESNES